MNIYGHQHAAITSIFWESNDMLTIIHNIEAMKTPTMTLMDSQKVMSEILTTQIMSDQNKTLSDTASSTVFKRSSARTNCRRSRKSQGCSAIHIKTGIHRSKKDNKKSTLFL
jgi:hypothetical protein